MLARALVLVFAASIPASAQKHYTELDYPPLRDLEVPAIEPIELPNGLRLYLLEDHSLPKVEGVAFLRTGSRFEPPEKTGLASLLGQVLRTGGSETRPGEEVDRLLENAGASVETGIGVSSGSASLFALPEHLPLVLEILADLLQNPALPEDKIELAKVQERTAIARQNDDVSAIASREFQELLYGEDSPYARDPEYATLARIEREDLVTFHQKYFHPNRTLLGLWGDFDSAEVRALVERTFGGWDRGEAPSDPPTVVERSPDGSVNYIEKNDVNQTSLRIGHLGGRVDDPDYFPLTVMAEILGGGFSSRLFQTVRSQRGLAYSVGASWNAAYDHPGSFYVSSSTKSETTLETVRAILDEIDRIANEPVSEEELKLAKDGILNSFVFNFDSKGEIVARLMTYEYYGYPADFLETYQTSIERVTAEDVLRAARERLRPDDLIVLAVGRSEDFDAPLSTLGEVRTIDITIPPPPAETPAAPAGDEESLARGRATLDQFVASARDTASDLTGFSLSGESVLTTPSGELPARFEILFQAPDRYREKAVLPFGEVVTVLDGDAGWASTPRGVQDLGDDQKRRTREGIYRHYPGLLWAAANGLFEAQWLENADGAASLLLTLDGLSMTGRFDESSGRLLSLTLPGTNLEGAPVTERREFTEFGPENLPRNVQIFHDGAPAARTRIDAVELNPKLADELFTRPSSP